MPTFTIPLHELIELTGGTLTPTDTPHGRISILTGGDIGIEGYPIFDETYRPILTGKIVDHYMIREIGTESAGLFRHAMRTTLNRVMPIYNKLYASEKITFDPLSTVDLTTMTIAKQSQEASSVSNSDTTTGTTSGARTVNSDTPQTQLAGNADYATSGTDATSRSEADAVAEDRNVSDTESQSDSETTMTGYQGVASELLIRYRETLINIDDMVIQELSPLFMQVWNNGDAYTPRGYYL